MKNELPIAPFRGVAGEVDDLARRRLPVLLGEPKPALRVGELAKRTGKTVRALHLYEELGLLEPASRTDSGYRMYSSDSVTRVEWIQRLQDAGLSLPEIRELLADWGRSASAPGAMQQVTEVYRRKLLETQQQIAKLRELEHELRSSLEYLATCTSCAPERVVSACPSCDRHSCDTHTPVLVAGLHAPSASSESLPSEPSDLRSKE
jgi:MerR family transcriptional regulator, copper efflux regulator